jgi:hypothetical protein
MRVKNEGDTDEDQPAIKVGDYVEWESNGILQFECKRIRSFSDDGTFAFVEGSNTGLRVSELKQVDAPKVHPLKHDLPPFRAEVRSRGNQTTKQDVFSLTEGEVILRWPTPLSQESIDDLKDWLKIVERKIARSVVDDSADSLKVWEKL